MIDHPAAASPALSARTWRTRCKMRTREARPREARRRGMRFASARAYGWEEALMARATLTITSKNYSSWSLRGWLLVRFAGLDFEERIVPADDPAIRAELLLLSSSILVPCLEHDGITVWDTLAIGEYLNDVRPAAGLLPADLGKRTRCRSICGEMHSGFTALRSSLPMNLKAHFPGFKIWSRARCRHRPYRGDLERVPVGAWRSVPFRRALDGRCHVCTRRHPLPYL